MIAMFDDFLASGVTVNKVDRGGGNVWANEEWAC